MGKFAPITAFVGLHADNPLRTLVFPEPICVKPLDFISLDKIINVDRMMDALENMRHEISEICGRQRKAAVNAHSRLIFVQPINFKAGDYVLVS